MANNTDMEVQPYPGKKVVSPKVIGILNLIFGLFGLTISISLSSIAEQMTDKSAGTVVIVTGFAVALPMIAGGIGLLMYRKAGRILALIAAFIAVTAGILYIILIILALIDARDLLNSRLMIKFILSVITMLGICIYPLLTIIFLHKKKVRDSMK